MSTLHDRLSDLADEEPHASTSPAPPGDLRMIALLARELL